MANQFNMSIMNDGWRNANVKITGVLDTSDAVLTPAISVNDFTSNDPLRTKLIGFRIDRIWHAIGDGLEIQLQWNAAVPQLIMAIAGRSRESWKEVGGLQPLNVNAPGFDGSINLITTGFGTVGSPTQNFTIGIDMVKLYQT